MSTNPDIAKFQRAMQSALHEHWKLYLIEGILLLVLGAVAILVPPIATLAITILFGWLFLVSGVIGLVTTFGCAMRRAFWWSMISAVLGIVVGIVLLAKPVSGALLAHARADRLLRHRGHRHRSCSRSITSANCPGNGAGCC